MKRIAALLVLVVAMSAVGIADSAKPPTGLPNADTVFGGGQFTSTILGTRNFSVSATSGSGTLMYNSVVAQITCVNISGNIAVVGGTITSSPGNPTSVGDPMDMYFEDNGDPSAGGDVVSTLEIGAPGGFGGLPKTCPAADISQALEQNSLTAGDIVVHAKGT